MKYLILFFFLVCSTNVLAQKSPNLYTKVFKQLNFSESESSMNWAAHKEFSNLPNQSLVVIPKIAEEEKGYIVLDAYILFVDNETGKIKAKFVEERAWTSDAYILYDIEIQPELYNLNEETKAFGIILTYETDSMVDRSGAKELSLFAKKDKDLVRVLKDYPLISSSSISNGRCNSEYEIHSRNIKVTDSITNQYFDLKVIDNVEKGKSTEENCEPRVVSKSQNIEFLKFRNGKYQSVSK